MFLSNLAWIVITTVLYHCETPLRDTHTGPEAVSYRNKAILVCTWDSLRWETLVRNKKTPLDLHKAFSIKLYFNTNWLFMLVSIFAFLSIYIFLPPSLFHMRRQWHPTPVLLPGKIPWMEEPGRLQSMGSLRVGHDWATSVSLFTFMHWRRKWQPTPVFLPGESQGQRSLVGCSLWGHTGLHRVGHDWSDLAAAAATALFHTHTHKHTHPSLPHCLFFSLLCSSFFSYLD